VEYIDSVIHGVQIGSVTYSFRPLDLDATLEGFRAVGLGECELWDAQVEPHDLKGEALAKWRLTTPLSYFQEVRQKLDRAGVLPYAYSVGPHT
jgi:sugar phosphate isomerase/epimerase